MDQNTRFTPETVARLGIAFPTREEAVAFAAFLEEEWEVRVGQELGRRLTDQELSEFDAIRDPQHSADWLDSHCPDYRSVVSAARQELESEVMCFRDRIAGTLPAPWLEEDDVIL